MAATRFTVQALNIVNDVSDGVTSVNSHAPFATSDASGWIVQGSTTSYPGTISGDTNLRQSITDPAEKVADLGKQNLSDVGVTYNYDPTAKRNLLKNAAVAKHLTRSRVVYQASAL